MMIKRGKVEGLKGDKRGANIITENIIFIVLNLIFLTIIVLFVFSRMGSAAVLEEKYAKQIALMIDGAESEMIIATKMLDAAAKASREGQPLEDVITINGNVVNVKINPKGSGYSYSFFSQNDVTARYLNRGVYTLVIKNE